MISKEELYKNKEIYKKNSIEATLQYLDLLITSAFIANKDFLEVKKDIFSYPEETLKEIRDKGYTVKEKEILVPSNYKSIDGTFMKLPEVGYEISWPESF